MKEPESPPVLPPPVLQRAFIDGPAPLPRRKYWLHPASGLFILATDWLFFAPEAITAEAAAIVTCPLAFLVTTVGVYWIQRRRNGDARGAAALKAVFGGVLAGLPLPIGGTVLGSLVLILSGLSNWTQRRGTK